MKMNNETYGKRKSSPENPIPRFPTVTSATEVQPPWSAFWQPDPLPPAPHPQVHLMFETLNLILFQKHVMFNMSIFPLSVFWT